MSKIEEVDKNFNVTSQLTEKDIEFFDIKQMQCMMYGAAQMDDNGIYRLPKPIAGSISEGVDTLTSNTAGVRVRFKTNSDYIAIVAEYSNISKFSHMTLTGSAGFDMYVYENEGYEFVKAFVPPVGLKDYYASEHYFDCSKMRDITINLPLYSSVKTLKIGLKRNSELQKSGNYINSKPIVYYGSSITQGGCASRPGLAYESIISRKFNCDYINLGFSGSAMGELKMAEYISHLDMCCVVYDYDHNAPTAQHLAKTHKQMYEIIRKNNPELPIIIASMPWHDKNNCNWAKERRAVIINTYNKAIDAGDKNVYFVDGMKYYESYGMSNCTIDGCHPNDLGFWAMANEFIKVMEKARIF